jgi:hypothetical protein
MKPIEHRPHTPEVRFQLGQQPLQLCPLQEQQPMVLEQAQNLVVGQLRG